ncbi:Ribonuclease H2 subunit C [Chionoecetes opilio]|uniref:Ribonuclease H2 subunit C n=1 Tax=Chionoecetes opilio TaxID=41210 RepID=A0A8J4XR08_CHIOP|nr:Ribonuclease H2 subunit C [Chionoecetes opilio]
MPVQIEVSKAQKKQDNHVHYIPCGIDFSGQADVDRNFSASVTEEEKGLDGRLRGRPLKGKQMKAPDGYTGLVLKEAQRSVGQGDQQVMKGVALFDSFTFWNYDRQPSRSDKFQQSLDWLEVASVVSGSATLQCNHKASVIAHDPSLHSKTLHHSQGHCITGESYLDGPGPRLWRGKQPEESMSL